MKLVTVMQDGKPALGVKTEAGIIDIAAALAVQPAGGQVPQDVMAVIEGGSEAVAALQAYVDGLPAGDAAYVLDEEAVEWGPCVTRPNKIICVGLNYRKHAEETNAPIPEYPILFNKFNNTLTGHKKDIAVPKVTEKLDYEAELVIVIGKRAKYVPQEQALDHVFGYAAVNDLSARDLQLRTQQWLLGKTCDDFSPLGPYLVTADEVGNPNDLVIKSIVNGEVRQNSNTADMIFKCDEIVSYISQHMTLAPGDIILTGTPEGVVMGYPPEKQVYVKPGDVVTIEIEKLGSLTNRFVEEA
ncbi:fumarylacetoacetate hydrolase family protein [Paenibacillus spongiae]|uniref:Fumarylacetoacetate hydrolase family protein n=1 Tax=Paenibacillus spongiae TaxID=2909671 RepID=A0ABY5S4Y6_9BACL|nr:fumarylacetoacetate hydrolase family protein [Paenibacillus spongiae]UVI28553.1 fumarylacetoacetate hydrolase family protein [Paenibacillus spongiae]